MTQAKQIENIIRDIKTLDYQGKLEILKQLVHFITKPLIKKPVRKHSLLELEGLGKEIWKGVDVDNYIDEQRNSWL